MRSDEELAEARRIVKEVLKMNRGAEAIPHLYRYLEIIKDLLNELYARRNGYQPEVKPDDYDH